MKKQFEKNFDPEYIRYVEHGDSAAVYIVRDIVTAIDTTNKWIDVLELDGDRNYDDQWDFKKIKVEIFPRRIKPQYTEFCDKKYLTWKTAHEDMSNQRNSGYKGAIYEVTTRLVNKNKGKKITVEKVWNKRFCQYVPKKWYMKSTCEIRKVQVNAKPEWEYHILGVKKLR